MADAIVCNPPVRLLPQFDPRWGSLPVHDKTNWTSSGCHPSAVFTVLRWHAEDSPNRGGFTFPSVDNSTIAHDKYPLRGAEAFWPELHGEVAANNNTVAHGALMKAACKALGMDPKQCQLPRITVATLREALANGPLAICMQHPGHFLVLQGIDDKGRLLICDPGSVLANASGKYWDPWQNVATGQGMPPKDQWPGGSPPGYERSAACYVAVHPTESYATVNGSRVNFINAISSAEQYINTKAGAPANPGNQPAAGGGPASQPAASGGGQKPAAQPGGQPAQQKPAEQKPADQKSDVPDLITEGGYDKVKIQLTGAAAGDKVKRPTKGSQVLWGGTDPSSPWGHLLAQIDKGGGSVNYTFCHASTIDKNLGTVRVTVAPETAAETPPDANEGQNHSQPIAPDRPPDAFLPVQQGQQAAGDQKPVPQGPIFEDGLDFTYKGAEARIWAHKACKDSGPRPLFVYLHGINAVGEKHPHLDPKHIHVGKLLGALTDEGKVAPCVVAAPTHASNRPWDKDHFNLGEFVSQVVDKAKEQGVAIDLDNVAVTGHSGAGGFPHLGMDLVADGKVKFTAGGGEHSLKLFGLMDTQFTASAASHYGDALKDGTTAFYAVHAGQAGYGPIYATHPVFAKNLGLQKADSLSGGVEDAAQLYEIYTNGSATPPRISIKVQQSKTEVDSRRKAWGATGGYHPHGDQALHWDLVPLWTWWGPARFFPASQADKDAVAKLKQAQQQPQQGNQNQGSQNQGGNQANQGNQGNQAGTGQQPQTGGNQGQNTGGGPRVEGGEFVIPDPPPVWEPSAGAAITPAPFADSSAAVYWPVRGRGRNGRQIAHKQSDGKVYQAGRHFLADRDSGRAHVGIDVWGDYRDVVVAIESGKVKNWYHFYHGVYCLIVQCDSGLVINYGEVDPGSITEYKWNIGGRITAGQPIARVGRMTGGSSMLHFETYPAGTTENQRHYWKDGESDLKARFFDPTQYLLALAKNGK